MLRLIPALILCLVSTFAHADEFEDADKAWSPGKPWPAHWGMVKYPYTEAWNVVFLGFIHKVYRKDEAADTGLKHMPSAMPEGASAEFCTVKRGLLEIASFCKPAVIEPALIGSLKEDDVVAFFYPNHGTKRFSAGPGSDPKTTLRIFQKISDAGDTSCWAREALVFKRPITDVCFKKIDAALVERLLTRDFGPRNGAQPANPPDTGVADHADAAGHDAANAEDATPEAKPAASGEASPPPDKSMPA